MSEYSQNDIAVFCHCLSVRLLAGSDNRQRERTISSSRMPLSEYLYGERSPYSVRLLPVYWQPAGLFPMELCVRFFHGIECRFFRVWSLTMVWLSFGFFLKLKKYSTISYPLMYYFVFDKYANILILSARGLQISIIQTVGIVLSLSDGRPDILD